CQQERIDAVTLLICRRAGNKPDLDAGRLQQTGEHLTNGRAASRLVDRDVLRRTHRDRLIDLSRNESGGNTKLEGISADIRDADDARAVGTRRIDRYAGPRDGVHTVLDALKHVGVTHTTVVVARCTDTTAALAQDGAIGIVVCETTALHHWISRG